MKLQRLIAFFLGLLLLAGLFTGCGGAPGASAVPSSQAPVVEMPNPTDETAASTEGTAAPALPSITWARAFRTNTVPEGSVASDSVAFLRKDASGELDVVNVSLEEIHSSAPERLPRTRYFEQFMPQAIVDELLPAIDYAMAGGYSRLCIPTTGFNYGTMQEAANFLAETYNVNGAGAPGSLEIQSFPQENGETLIFMLITLGGMEVRGLSEQYRQAVAAAEEIVDAMPKDLDERGKMLYLYKYLTDHVRYDSNSYYKEHNWCLLYDALIRHSTVCAGYTEALYVLANLAGIECLTARGYINIADPPDYHIWNIAKINGCYYQFDATWDEGDSPADYSYFGVSDDYMMKHHTEYITDFDKEYCPLCEKSLLPEALPLDGASAQEYPIIWYFRLCNARAYQPVRMLQYLGFSEEEINEQEPEDGWVQTSVNLSDAFNVLLNIFTMDQATVFFPGYCISGDKNNLRFRVPEEDPPCTRLTGLEKNKDGTWTAHTFVYSSGTIAPQDYLITLEANAKDWYVVKDVTPVDTGSDASNH